MLTKSDIKRKLLDNSPLLKKYHVNRIGIFGSFVTGSPDDKSDIDLLVDFSDTISLFEYVHLTDSITAILNKDIDLVDIAGIKSVIKEKVLNEVEWIEGL